MVCNRQRGFLYTTNYTAFWLKGGLIVASVANRNLLEGVASHFNIYQISVQFIMIYSENQRHDLSLIMKPKDPHKSFST